MTEASYTAWDDKQYVWPPPEGWYESSDGKWWPEGYGPPTEITPTDGSDADGTADATVAENEAASAESSRLADSGSIDLGTASARAFDTEPSAESMNDTVAADLTATAQWEIDADSDTDSDSGSDWGSDAETSSGLAASAGAAIDAAASRADDFGDESKTTSDDGSGAFSSVPMEMNDLSSVSQADLSAFDTGAIGEVESSLADLEPPTDSTAYSSGFSTLAEGVPNIDDVMPAEEITFDPPVSDGHPAVSDAYPAVSGDTPPVADENPGFAPVAGPAVDDAGSGDTPGAGDDLATPGDAPAPAPDLGPVAETGAGRLTAADVDRRSLGDLAAPVVEDPAFGRVADPDVDAAGSAGSADHGFGASEPVDPSYGLDEGATQVVSAELPSAPANFVPPPPDSSGGFAPPPPTQQLSPLDRSTATPAPAAPDPYSDGAGFDPVSSPPVDYGAHPPAGASYPASADQFSPPGPDFDPPPGQPPSGQPQGGFGGAGVNTAPGFGGPMAPDPGLHAQAILGAKPRGGRSKALLLVMLGVLVLVAVGAALYVALGGGTDDSTSAGAGTSGPGSIDQPHPRSTGVVVFYPDGDTDQRWVVEVLEPVRDATAEIVEDGSGAPPEGGNIFAATTIRVRNESGVDGASLGDLHFNAVTAGGTVIDRSTSQCSASGDDLDLAAPLPLGSQVEGAVCWSIPAADLAGLMLGIQTDKVSGRVHIALQ